MGLPVRPSVRANQDVVLETPPPPRHPLLCLPPPPHRPGHQHGRWHPHHPSLPQNGSPSQVHHSPDPRTPPDQENSNIAPECAGFPSSKTNQAHPGCPPPVHQKGVHGGQPSTGNPQCTGSLPCTSLPPRN